MPSRSFYYKFSFMQWRHEKMKFIHKKNILSTIILFAFSGAHAADINQLDNTWYLGGNLGWSSYHHDGDFTKGKSNNKVGTAGFIGYQFTPYLALETGYNILGSEKSSNGYKSDVEGWQLTGKFSYPATDNINIYTRLGGMLYRNDVINDINDSSEASSGVAPIVAVGGEYYFGGHWTGRLEYQWASKLGKDDAAPDNGYLSIGATYHFMPKPVPVIFHDSPVVPALATPPTAAPAPVSSVILFDYNHSDLSEQNKLAIDDFYHKSVAPAHQPFKIQSIGYADSNGSQHNNNIVAQRRADSAGTYLSALGVKTTDITIDSAGETTQFDQEDCSKYQSAADKKSCSAANRRVTLMITGVDSPEVNVK